MGCGASNQAIVRDFLGVRPAPLQSANEFEKVNLEVPLNGKRLSAVDVLNAQRQQAPDVTKHLEDRWINNHFAEFSTRQSGSKLKRRRLSHVTTAEERISETSWITPTEQEEFDQPNSLLPVVDVRDYQDEVS